MNILFEPLFDAALRTLCFNKHTPWMVCATTTLDLPESLIKHIQSERIVFNLSADALRSLIKKNQCIYLELSSEGRQFCIEVPYENVIALLSKEDHNIQVKFSHPPKSNIEPKRIYDIPQKHFLRIVN